MLDLPTGFSIEERYAISQKFGVIPYFIVHHAQKGYMVYNEQPLVKVKFKSKTEAASNIGRYPYESNN